MLRNVGHMTFSGAMICQINRTFYSYVKNWGFLYIGKLMFYVTTAAQVKSVCLSGINSFKVLARAHKAPPSISCLLWPGISLQTKTRSWLVWEKNTYFRVYWVIKHVLHITYYLLSIQYISFFHSFLKGRSLISDDVFHINPFHCYLHYSQHLSIWETSRDDGRWKT